jgi:hypothetical protein
MLGGLSNGPVPSQGASTFIGHGYGSALGFELLFPLWKQDLFCLSTVVAIKSHGHMKSWKWQLRETLSFLSQSGAR